MPATAILSLALMTLGLAPAEGNGPPTLIRSAHDGRWSDPAAWEGGRVPFAGARVQVRERHTILYDVRSTTPIRSIHIAGVLRFDPDTDTRLDVGLIKIQAGDDASESGFDCESHAVTPSPRPERATLEVGAPDRPIARDHTALIRLTPAAGLDPDECPAIICCGGRMDFHGAEMSQTWVKLGDTAATGMTTLTLAEPVSGWRVGDRVIVTATNRQRVADQGDVPSVRAHPQTEERTIRVLEGSRLTLDAPLVFTHTVKGTRRGEVANLSRNVIVESAAPGGSRGHTMYHRYSTGSISYAEFRHLGKTGKLGKYSLHFHKVADTMRGASVVGASIWDSGNRWITIHGTNFLAVRDCVGYGSVGHGFFLEDGTEVDNILDGNLAVQACQGSQLPGQALSFDRNEGAGFWWANSRNAFMRNVAVECDQYGFRYEAPAVSGFDGVLNVRGSDDVRRPVDIRTLSFLRFEENEAHTQRRYGLNLGGGPGNGSEGGVGGVGPDSGHPFVIRGCHVWDAHWAVALAAPGVLIDGLDIAHSDFGLWRPRYERHAYRKVAFYQTGWAFYAETGRRPDPAIFPSPLDPVDDRPPVTVITRAVRHPDGRLVVRGVAADDGTIRSIKVNAQAVRSTAHNYAQWEVVLEGDQAGTSVLIAVAEDEAGNREQVPHRALLPFP